jgi:predicted dehydrogenase
MDQVRIAIVGAGGMGSGHAGYLSNGEVPGAVLTALCDTDPKRIEALRARFGDKVRYFTSAEELFAAKVCDAIMVATPHYFHPTLAIAAFKHGLHVLIEKPAGVYTKQVREANEAAKASGLVFGAMLNQRTRTLHQKFRELMQSGEMGEIIRTNWIITSWFRSQSYYNSGGWRATWSGEGGGVLANQCPHNLDLWQWICGMPVKVRAFCGFGKYHDIEVEDDVTAYVEYANGATGVFITSTAEAPGTNRLEVSGDRGKMVMENGQLTFWRSRESVGKFRKEYKGGFGSPEVWKCEIPVRDAGEEHKGITKNWTQAILKGTPLLAPGEEGIHSVQLFNAMLLSSWTDSWVSLPVDEELYLAELNKRIATSRYQKPGASGQALNVAGTFN